MHSPTIPKMAKHIPNPTNLKRKFLHSMIIKKKKSQLKYRDFSVLPAFIFIKLYSSMFILLGVYLSTQKT